MRPCLRRSTATVRSLSPARLPLRILPSEATARKKKVAIRGPPTLRAKLLADSFPSNLLRHAQHFRHRSQSALDFPPGVFPQIAHAVAAGHLGDRRCVGIGHD